MSRSLKFHTFFNDDDVNNVSIVVVFVAKEAVLETVVIVGVANNKGE